MCNIKNTIQKMKKSVLFAIVAAGMFLASCGGNSETATAPADSLTVAVDSASSDSALVAADTAAVADTVVKK